MARLEWDKDARPYYAGVDHGVLYLDGLPGIAWNGLVSANEVVSGGAASAVYVDGRLAGNIRDSEDFVLNVSAYTYPSQFEKYTGFDNGKSGQGHPLFSLSYRTGDSSTGQIHLVYNARLSPLKTQRQSQSKATNVELFEWQLISKPFNYSKIKSTSHAVIDLKLASANAKKALFDEMYGTSTSNSKLPTLEDLLLIFEVAAPFSVIDNGDGTWTATMPDSALTYIDANTYQITWPTATDIDGKTFRLSSEF